MAGALHQARGKAELQRVQCLWLRASLGLTANQVARAMGWQPASVRRLPAQYLREGEADLPAVGRGGRRHPNLTIEQEQQLLAAFRPSAGPGVMREVSPIQGAYEQTVEHAVPQSTIYRMLSRHGWRKIAPRRRPPRTNRQRQGVFKKTSPDRRPIRPAGAAKHPAAVAGRGPLGADP